MKMCCLLCPCSHSLIDRVAHYTYCIFIYLGKYFPVTLFIMGNSLKRCSKCVFLQTQSQNFMDKSCMCIYMWSIRLKLLTSLLDSYEITYNMDPY
jgi:hypothetical protein